MATQQQQRPSPGHGHKLAAGRASNDDDQEQEPPPPPSKLASQAGAASRARASSLAASAIASGAFGVASGLSQHVTPSTAAAAASNASLRSNLPPPSHTGGSAVITVPSTAIGVQSVQIHSAPATSNTSLYPKHPHPGSHTSMIGSRAMMPEGGGGGGGDEPPPFQEADYLKQAIGLPLIGALADVCIKRPADPIEYLGHWLVHWKFNHELRKHDVKTALELVQQKEWGKYKEILGFTSSGFTPQNPYGPIGYGGPEFGGADDEGAGGDFGCGDEVPGETGNQEVEQLYRNSRMGEHELAGEYGAAYYGQGHGYDEGEESERPVSFYSEPPPTSTATITGNERSSAYSTVHTAESYSRGSTAPGQGQGHGHAQPGSTVSSRSVMTSREVHHRQEARTRNESLPHSTDVPPQYRRPSEEPPAPSSALSVTSIKSQLSSTSVKKTAATRKN